MTGDTARLDHCRVRGHPRLFGFRQGFIVGVLSFGGFAIGAFLGTRLGPLLLAQGSSSPYAPAFGLLGALLGGAILASGLEGLGFRLRRTLVIPGHGPARRAARRGCSGAALGLGIVWIARRRGGPDAGPGPAARGHPALGDPARAQPGPAAAVGADPERARAAGSAALDHGSLAGRRRAGAADRARAGREDGVAQRRARAAAPPAGWRSRARAGWPSRTSW